MTPKPRLYFLSATPLLLLWIDLEARGVAWWVLPFVPPLVFMGFLLLVERGAIFRDIRYLREALARDA